MRKAGGLALGQLRTLAAFSASACSALRSAPAPAPPSCSPALLRPLPSSGPPPFPPSCLVSIVSQQLVQPASSTAAAAAALVEAGHAGVRRGVAVGVLAAAAGAAPQAAAAPQGAAAHRVPARAHHAHAAAQRLSGGVEVVGKLQAAAGHRGRHAGQVLPKQALLRGAGARWSGSAEKGAVSAHSCRASWSGLASSSDSGSCGAPTHLDAAKGIGLDRLVRRAQRDEAVH